MVVVVGGSWNASGRCRGTRSDSDDCDGSRGGRSGPWCYANVSSCADVVVSSVTYAIPVGRIHTTPDS